MTVFHGRNIKFSSQDTLLQLALHQASRGQTASHGSVALNEVDTSATENSSQAVQQSLDAIATIQKIYVDVLKFVNRVEEHPDEMLT